MIEIKCMQDVRRLAATKLFPEEIVQLVGQDLHTIKCSDDLDELYDMETFHTDLTGNGYIVLLEGDESPEEIVNLGLSEGLAKTIPEAVNNYHIGSDKWVCSIIIYNNSFAMIIWLRNSDIFDQYAV